MKQRTLQPRLDLVGWRSSPPPLLSKAVSVPWLLRAYATSIERKLSGLFRNILDTNNVREARFILLRFLRWSQSPYCFVALVLYSCTPIFYPKCGTTAELYWEKVAKTERWRGMRGMRRNRRH